MFNQALPLLSQLISLARKVLSSDWLQSYFPKTGQVNHLYLRPPFAVPVISLTYKNLGYGFENICDIAPADAFLVEESWTKRHVYFFTPQGQCAHGNTAILFERIPIQDQAYNRKSFTSRADKTATWERTPRNARDGELEIRPESLQTRLSDNFMPPPAKKVARKTQLPARSDSNHRSSRPNTDLRPRSQRAAKTSVPKNRRRIAVKQPSRTPIEVTDSSEPDSHDDLYASDPGRNAHRQPEVEQVEGPSDEIMLTLQNLSDLSIQSPKAGAQGHSRGPPFLRSQLRKSFLKRCEAEGIPIKGGKMREPEITYVYRTLGSNNTFKTTVKHWGCPLCDTYSSLETRQVLERHLGDRDGGHPEVKVETRKENVSYRQPRISVA